MQPLPRHRRHQAGGFHASRTTLGALTAAVIGLVCTIGRYGFKRTTGLLQMAGWDVNQKRVQHIWRREGHKISVRRSKTERP